MCLIASAASVSGQRMVAAASSNEIDRGATGYGLEYEEVEIAQN